MGDFSVRATIIGVSLFITMITFTAVFMYFNSARSIADEVNKRIDIAATFDYIMNPEITEAYLTGVEVRSLITKYANNKEVTINILKISGENVTGMNNINNAWLYGASKLLRDDKMHIINPIWKNRVTKEETRHGITLNLELDV